MSYRCAICGKGPVAGKTVSHSKKHSCRSFRPNLQKMKILLKGKKTQSYVCTGCIKSGKVIKAC